MELDLLFSGTGLFEHQAKIGLFLNKLRVLRNRFLREVNFMRTDECTISPDAAALVKAVGNHPFLKGMSVSNIQILVDSAMFKDFAAGELIFAEGDIANRFYLLLDGKVALESRDKADNRTLVQTISAGDVLGWSWLFPPNFWRFDARAIEPTKAIFFYGTRLREQCESNPVLGYDLMTRMAGVIVERLQNTRQQLLDCFRKKAESTRS